MEAFSDGVIAILITIMVLELTVPHGSQLGDIAPLAPVFLSYVLGFINLAIWWNNHHHLLQAAQHVDGRILWANLHLLFWLSLLPWTTAWMGENDFASLPVAAAGADLLLAGFAYYLLVRALIAHERGQSTIAAAIGRDVKGKISPILYLLAIPIAFVAPWASVAIYVVVAAIWFVPDLRIERRIAHDPHEG
jgi:uncharacterized membrane protein